MVYVTGLWVNDGRYLWHRIEPMHPHQIVNVDCAAQKFHKQRNAKRLEGARKFGENTLSPDKMKRMLDLWKLCK